MSKSECNQCGYYLPGGEPEHCPGCGVLRPFRPIRNLFSNRFDAALNTTTGFLTGWCAAHLGPGLLSAWQPWVVEGWYTAPAVLGAFLALGACLGVLALADNLLVDAPIARRVPAASALWMGFIGCYLLYITAGAVRGESSSLFYYVQGTLGLGLMQAVRGLIIQRFKPSKAEWPKRARHSANLHAEIDRLREEADQLLERLHRLEGNTAQTVTLEEAALGTVDQAREAVVRHQKANRHDRIGLVCDILDNRLERLEAALLAEEGNELDINHLLARCSDDFEDLETLGAAPTILEARHGRLRGFLENESRRKILEESHKVSGIRIEEDASPVFGWDLVGELEREWSRLRAENDIDQEFPL